jgi:hypothetical protein
MTKVDPLDQITLDPPESITKKGKKKRDASTIEGVKAERIFSEKLRTNKIYHNKEKEYQLDRLNDDDV